MQGNGGYFNITRQKIPGEFEAVPSTSSIIVHYTVQVDVLDSQYNLVASRTKPKEIQISFNGLSRYTDLEEVADSLIGQSDLLSEKKRNDLMTALRELQMQTGNTPIARRFSYQSLQDEASKPNRSKSSSCSNLSRPESAGLALKLSKAEVDNLLHDALQKIHWGKENECIQTLQTLVDIAQYDRNLTLIIQHEPLMNTLINGLKKFAASSLNACIYIMTIFEKMSYFANFQDILGKFKIGSISLSLLHAQVVLTNVADKNLNKEKMQQYISLQNQLFILITSLLYNLASNPNVMRKMVNKNVVEPLILLLQRKNAELVTKSLLFLRKIANVNVNWSDFPYDQVIDSISKYVFKWTLTDSERKVHIISALNEALELLFVFSFHSETFEEFKEKKVFENIEKICSYVEIRSSLIKFLYNCSQFEGSFSLLKNETIINTIISAATTECDERMISLIMIMNLAQDKDCSLIISKSSTFTSDNIKKIFIQATKTQSQENNILLKLIRNISDNQPNLVTGFDNEIIKAIINNYKNMDMLCDIFAISSRGKMNSSRAKLFTSDKNFIKILMQILSKRNLLPQLHLECVIFVSSVVLFSEPAKVLVNEGIVAKIIDVFKWYPEDLDIQTQCLFAFYRLVIHKESRNELLEHSEVINKIIQHSSAKNKLSNSLNKLTDSLSREEKDILMSYANVFKDNNIILIQQFRQTSNQISNIRPHDRGFKIRLDKIEKDIKTLRVESVSDFELINGKIKKITDDIDKKEKRNNSLQTPALRPKPHKSNNESPISEFQDYLIRNGGRTGGWDSDSHSEFLRQLQRHGETDLFLYLPDIPKESVLAHIEWYNEFCELKHKMKLAINQQKSQNEQNEQNYNPKPKRKIDSNALKQRLEERERIKNQKLQDAIDQANKAKQKEEELRRKKYNELQKEFQRKNQEKVIEKEEISQNDTPKQVKILKADWDRIRKRDNEATERRKMILHAKEAEKIEREEKTRKFIEANNRKFRHAKRDPERLMRPTTAMLAKQKKDENEQKGPVNSVFDIPHRATPKWML
ncbi:kinesin-associated protein 3-like [Histomonas meleagridis]|uniref:kinesin-associated protein 3-like n=1 Tax=Histomonas meleagridis TaxID=135588 RepID=UPI003559641A|nr:kinesin-associated protein 3-like [Histomonas meleagridis]KAH0798543.1 kinesin-associated protein 3-like [Histomonas meleagridis]